MKAIKIIIITLLIGSLALVTRSADAQEDRKTEFTYSLKGNAADKRMVIDDFYSDITIIATQGSEIRIVVQGYKGLPEKAKGLKPLGGAGDENTGIGLSFNPNGNNLSVSAANRSTDDASYTFYLPESLNVKIVNQGWKGGDIDISGMTGELEVSTQIGDLKLKDVTGPIVAHTLSSDIEVIFSTVDQRSPSSVSSTSGDIDITLPASSKGTFSMATTSGGVYTDLDFDLGKKEGTRKIISRDAIGKLNGGGIQVTLKTISGDIFIRNSK